MLVSTAEIETCISPYVREYLDPRSPAWTEILAKAHRPARPTHRSQSAVRETYEKRWATVPESGLPPQTKHATALWGDRPLIIDGAGLKRVHLLYLYRLIERLGPLSALEVGFGSGANLVVLANLCPVVRFAGIELTQAGVARCASLLSKPISEDLATRAPAPLKDTSAHSRLDIAQASATDIPYASNSFDLVFTVQALEQMEPVKHRALQEIARVAAKHVIMIEPFRDWNQSEIRRKYVAESGYFSSAVADLEAYGLRPIFMADNFPAKLKLGVGVVLASCAERT